MKKELKKVACFCLAIFILQVYSGFSQKKEEDKPKPSVKDKIVFGGYLNLAIGTQFAFIGISPNIGYYITPVLLAGTGATYEYFRENKTSFHIYGYRVFTSYDFIPDISKIMPVKSHIALFAHAEFEALNLNWQLNNFSLLSGRHWLYSPLIGLGMKQPLGKKSSFNIVVLYNLKYSNNLPYSNPMIRIGFYF